MKNRECAVVQDLLVLYEDDVLQPESKEMIEEHLAECQECRTIYQKGKGDIPILENENPKEKSSFIEESAVEFMRRMQKKASQKRTKRILVAVLIVTILMAGAHGTAKVLTDGRGGIRYMLRHISAKEVSVVKKYRLKNGDVYLVVEAKNGYWMSTGSGGHHSLMTTEVSEEMIGEIYLENLGCLASFENWMPKSNQAGYVFAQRESASTEEEKKGRYCEQIDYIGKTDKDRITVWTKEDELKPAPDNIEKKAIMSYVEAGAISKARIECDNMGWATEELFEQTEDGLGLYDQVTYCGPYWIEE